MQQLVDFVVVVVVVPDAPHCLDVVPAGAAEQRGVDAGVSAHRAVRQVVDRPELVVQALRRVLVKPDQYCKLLQIPHFVFFLYISLGRNLVICTHSFLYKSTDATI